MDCLDGQKSKMASETRVSRKLRSSFEIDYILNQALAFQSLKLLCMFSLSFHPLGFGRIVGDENFLS